MGMPVIDQSSNNIWNALTDIIQSVALEQTALSHILNAEGEKIQLTLEKADNFCDIIKVNELVNKTIINITNLEHVLYAKLQSAQDISETIMHNCQQDCNPCGCDCNPCGCDCNPCGCECNPFGCECDNFVCDCECDENSDC